MMHGLIATMLAVPTGWACGDGNKASASASCEDHGAEPTPVVTDPGRRAKSTDLMGAGNCSWSTSHMAQKVLDEGQPFTYVGTLQKSSNELPNRVAAPYTVGPDADIHVIANEVLDQLSPADATTARLELRGKLLAVDDVQYLVVTEIARGNT